MRAQVGPYGDNQKRFYVWIDSGGHIQSAWRVPGLCPGGSHDCTDMSDEEFGRFMDSMFVEQAQKWEWIQDPHDIEQGLILLRRKECQNDMQGQTWQESQEQ